MQLQKKLDGSMLKNLSPIAFGLGGYYLLITIAHWFVLAPPVLIPMMSVAFVSAVVLFLLFWILQTRIIPHPWSHAIGAAIAGIVLVNSLAHLYLTSEPKQTTNIALLTIGISCFFLSPRWYAGCLFVICAGWATVMFQFEPLMEHLHFVFLQSAAMVLSLLIFVVRYRSYCDFHTAVNELEQTQRRLVERTSELEQTTRELDQQIQERKQVKDELAHTNARLNAVLNAATQVSIIATNTNGLITVFNKGAERMVGYRAEEMVGKQTPAILHLECEVIAHGKRLSKEFGYPVEGFHVFVERARRGGYDEQEWTYVKKDGTQITVMLAVTAVLDADGGVAGFLGVATDVTSRIRSDALRRASEERLRAVVDNALDGILTINLDGVIESFNPAAERIFGYPSYEMIGQNICRLLPEFCRENEDSRIFNYLLTDKAIVIGISSEFAGYRKDGSVVLVEQTISEMRLDGSRHFICILRDISERKILEEIQTQQKELLQILNQATSRFVASDDSRIIFENMLCDLLKITQSKYGFIGEVIPEESNPSYLKLHAVSHLAANGEPRVFQEERDGRGWKFPLVEMIGANALASGKPLLCNRPEEMGEYEKLWGIHPPLETFLSIPIFSGNQLIGLYGIANRPHGYDQSVIDLLAPFSSTCGILIEAIRTEQKRVHNQKALLENETYVRAILDNVIDSIITTNEQGIVESFNPAAERIFGYDAGEMIGQNVSLLMPAPYRNHHDDYIANYIRSGKAKIIGIGREAVACRKDQSIFPIELALSEMKLENRRLFIGIIRDITERKQAEKALRESEERMQDFLDNANDLVQSVAPDGRLLYVNRAWKKTFGYDDDEIAKLNIFQLISPRFTEHCRQAFHQVMHGNELTDIEAAFVTKQGDEIIVSGSANCRFEDGKPVATRSIFRDVTRQKHAEEELKRAKVDAEKANQAKSEFLANMSHELRTPLNSIIGFSNILLKNKKYELSDKNLNFVARIFDNGQHLLELINDVLDLSKVEAGRVELEITPVSLGDLVHETFSQLEGQVRGKDVEFAVEIPLNLRPIETDEAKLKQVLINLLGNAIKFTEKGSIKVRILTDSQTENPIRLDVEDTGIGIPGDKLDTIFEAFQQADSSTTRKYGGTGLGLTISRSLCQLMGYRLEACSEIGKGSVFSIQFTTNFIDLSMPSLSDQKESLQKILPQDISQAGEFDPAAFQNKKVLIIDDEADSRLLIRHYLEEFGCIVLQAASGEEGLKMAHENSPDLITLDLMMPQISGWEMLRILKSDPQLQHIPVVIVSIVGKEHRGTLLGAVDYLDKPLKREDLLSVMERNLTGEKGKVLLVESDHNVAHQITEFLGQDAYEIRLVEKSYLALTLLEEFRPDLIILDQSDHTFDEFTFFDRIRKDGRYCHIPVVIMTNINLDLPQRPPFESEHSTILFKGEQFEENLKRIVKSIFQEKVN